MGCAAFIVVPGGIQDGRACSAVTRQVQGHGRATHFPTDRAPITQRSCLILWAAMRLMCNIHACGCNIRSHFSQHEWHGFVGSACAFAAARLQKCLRRAFRYVVCPATPGSPFLVRTPHTLPPPKGVTSYPLFPHGPAHTRTQAHIPAPLGQTHLLLAVVLSQRET